MARQGQLPAFNRFRGLHRIHFLERQECDVDPPGSAVGASDDRAAFLATGYRAGTVSLAEQGVRQHIPEQRKLEFRLAEGHLT